MEKNQIIKLVAILFMLSLPIHIFSQKKLDIDEKEKAIRKEKLKKLSKESFMNRSNEKADEKTKKADIETGKTLANLLNSNPTQSHKHKGIIVRRFDTDEEGRLGGDVLDMTQEASYGHINGIIRMISGYVNQMFKYNMEDSELLALYVIYYNFKHRGNFNYIGQNFDTDYSKFLKKEKVGIPENFEGWAGRTEILIPIEKNLLKGGGLDIATYELEDQVNPDIDVQSKKNFDNLQKRKLKSEKEEVTGKYDQTLKNEKQLLDRRAAIDAQLAELMKDPIKNKAEIERLQAERKKIDEELAKISLEKKGFETKIEQINRRDEMRKLGFTSEKEFSAYQASKAKTAPIVTEETKIEIKPESKSDTKAEKIEIKEEPKGEKTQLKESSPAYTSKVPKNYIQAFHSKGKVIVARESIYIPDAGIVAIGYESPITETSSLNLFLIGAGEFEIVKTLEGVKLAPETPFLFIDGKIFIYEEFSGKVYLTQLSPRLDIEARSSDPIDPDSTVIVTQDVIKVIKNKKTGSGDELNFKKKDLSLIK